MNSVITAGMEEILLRAKPSAAVIAPLTSGCPEVNRTPQPYAESSSDNRNENKMANLLFEASLAVFSGFEGGFSNEEPLVLTDLI